MVYTFRSLGGGGYTNRLSPTTSFQCYLVIIIICSSPSLPPSLPTSLPLIHPPTHSPNLPPSFPSSLPPLASIDDPNSPTTDWQMLSSAIKLLPKAHYTVLKHLAEHLHR